jgi:hypothetical protein
MSIGVMDKWFIAPSVAPRIRMTLQFAPNVVLLFTLWVRQKGKGV